MTYRLTNITQIHTHTHTHTHMLADHMRGAAEARAASNERHNEDGSNSSSGCCRHTCIKLKAARCCSSE